MTIRVSIGSPVPGLVLVGQRGWGVLGSAIPTGGESLSPLLNDLEPGDESAELWWQILTPPSAGTFRAFDDGRFSFTGAPDGAYSFQYRLRSRGVYKGVATAGISIGALTGTTLSGAPCSQSASSGAGAVTVTPAAVGAVNLAGAGCAQGASSAAGAVAVGSATLEARVAALETRLSAMLAAGLLVYENGRWRVYN